MIGRRFNRVIVIDEALRFPNGRSKRRYRMCLVVCDCNASAFWTRKWALDSGRTQSCGCLRIERVTAVISTHKRSFSREYFCWHNMIQRCYNEKHPQYVYYGGRGIDVCEHWLGGFEAFFQDMGECADGLSLDRIDNDDGYSKDNCRWATRSEQMSNTRASARRAA